MIKLVFAIFLACIFGQASAEKVENELDGFRSIKWGDNIKSNIKEMKFVGKSKDKKYYTRKGDKMSIGGADLALIMYGYYQERLATVKIVTDTESNKYALLKAFESQFGNPYRPNEFIEYFLWRGEITTIFFDCSEPSAISSCRVTLDSRVLEDEIEKAGKKAAEEAKKDF